MRVEEIIVDYSDDDEDEFGEEDSEEEHYFNARDALDREEESGEEDEEEEERPQNNFNGDADAEENYGVQRGVPVDEMDAADDMDEGDDDDDVLFLDTEEVWPTQTIYHHDTVLCVCVL